MEASGSVRLIIEAKLSPGPPMLSLRRHGTNSRWHGLAVSVASGNFLAAKVISKFFPFLFFFLFLFLVLKQVRILTGQFRLEMVHKLKIFLIRLFCPIIIYFHFRLYQIRTTPCKWYNYWTGKKKLNLVCCCEPEISFPLLDMRQNMTCTLN